MRSNRTIFASLAAIAFAVTTVATARTTTLVDCLLQSVNFDEVDRLRYAFVRQGPGPAIFFPDYPRQCDATDPEGCPGREWLYPGDIVAIGKTCDNWAFVKVLDTAHPRIGWIAATRLVSRGRPGNDD